MVDDDVITLGIGRDIVSRKEDELWHTAQQGPHLIPYLCGAIWVNGNLLHIVRVQPVAVNDRVACEQDGTAGKGQ